MFPLLLNKAVSTLWPNRPRPSGGPGPRRHSRRRKRINLALQGGGAHGAFTWGVLDQLLTDERLTIEGISGASAGALNAVMLADGLARGGPPGARKRPGAFLGAGGLGGHPPDLQRGGGAAGRGMPASALPISGARRASAATCRISSVAWSSACSRSCRAPARRLL